MDTTAPLLGEPLPVELMNTIWADRDGLHDAIKDPADLARWLLDVDLTDDLTIPSDSLTEQFRELRDALRRLAAETTGDVRPIAAADAITVEAAVMVVNRACAYTPTWSELSWSVEPNRADRSAREGAGLALSAIAEGAACLFASPDRDRLRACPGPTCVLYFVRDHPRREWCSAGCGNRARVARHYQRHHRSSGGSRASAAG